MSDGARESGRMREEGNERGGEEMKKMRSERRRREWERETKRDMEGEGEGGRDGEVGDREIKGRERMKERCGMTGDE